MTSRRGSGRNSAWLNVLAALIGIAVLGGLWELLVRVFDVKEFILPPPSTIASEIAGNPRLYLDAAAVTGRHAYLGMLIALCAALLFGSLLATSRFLEQAAQPLLVLILVAPWVAYFAAIVAWLGPGDPPVLFLVSLVAVPGFVFATVSGLRSADADARELLASVHASPLEVLWRLRLPSALPGLLATARFVVGISLAAAYYGEGGNLSVKGLGSIGKRAAAAGNGPLLWSSVFVTVALGVLGLLVVTIVERVLLRWHVSQRRRPWTDAGPASGGGS